MILIYTLIALVVNASLVKILHILIQHGQMFGAWQNVLRGFAESGHDWLAKPLGSCEVCFSHFVPFINFFVYLGFMVSNDLWFDGIFNNLIMYIGFVSTGAMMGVFFITKLFN